MGGDGLGGGFDGVYVVLRRCLVWNVSRLMMFVVWWKGLVILVLVLIDSVVMILLLVLVISSLFVGIGWELSLVRWCSVGLLELWVVWMRIVGVVWVRVVMV